MKGKNNSKEIDIFILDDNDKKYMIQISKIINIQDLFYKINDILEEYDINIIYKNKIYKENQNEILHLNQGDILKISKERTNENFTLCKFHLNANLNEEDMNTENLTGILNLCLVKYIASNITNIELIESSEIREIITELKKDIKYIGDPKEDIKALLSESGGNNIISYINYIDSLIKENEIKNLINTFDKVKQKEITSFWSQLSKYQTFNELFEKDFLKAIEKSYFDYSLIGVSIYQQERRKEFLSNLKKCNNVEAKFLFHGTQIDPISKIITEGFKYSKRPFYGMGIYFSDMLDYVSFYSGGKDFDSRRDNFGLTLPVNSTFSCIASEIYYNKDLKKNIYDDSLYVEDFDEFPTYEEIKKDYEDKMVEKDGVHFVRVAPEGGQVKNINEINTDREKGLFLGTEYVITEMEQILPLYGLTLKRNEYFVIWRDPNFKGKNFYSDYLYERKMFMYKYATMNAFFESCTEKALEIIKRKKFNKIILISSIGLDLSGKKFVEIARKILGFDVVVLFFSANTDHLEWIQKFPNALYTNDADFYKDYIINYNEKGLLNLKKQIENYYEIKLNFTKDFIQFPKYINEKEYKDLIFEDISDNFRRVIIKNITNNYLLLVDKPNREVTLKENNNKEIDSFIWYVTIIGDEITFYSNESYLGVNEEDNQNVNGQEFMKRWKFELQQDNMYIFYYGNKNCILTGNNTNLILNQKQKDNINQLFNLIDYPLE